MRLYLIRHPPPAVAPGICYGRTDLALREPVAPLARRLRALLPADAPLFSSPLQRCRQLAEALHRAPVLDDRLLEMHFGDWEMQPWDAIDRQTLDAWAARPLEFAPPGGESAAQLMRRVCQFHEELLTTKIETVTLVTHAGVIKALSGALRRLPAHEWMRQSFDFGSLTVLEQGEAIDQ